MPHCPINPKDYINAPYGAFAAAVREYDPEYGRGSDNKYKFIIEYDEVRTTTIKHRAVVEAYSFEDAKKQIKEDGEGFIEDDEIDEEDDYSYEYFREVEREVIDG